MLPKPRRGRRGLILAAVLPMWLARASVVALAQTETGELIRLQYRATAGCPDEAAFLARVRTRTAHARFVGEGEPARTFSVNLENGAPSWGSVTITEGDRAEGTRRLEADSCDQVADGVALMVALALDPRALGGLAPAVSEVEAGPLPPAVPEIPDASAAGDLDASPAPPPANPIEVSYGTPTAPPLNLPPSQESDSAAEANHPPSPLRAFVRHFIAGADVALATGVTPKTLFAGTPYLDWRSSAVASLAAAFRVAFLRAGTGTVPVGTGNAAADFTWTVGRIDGCATLRPTRRVGLSPCACLEGGALEVHGDRVPEARTQHSAWIAAGPVARVEWTLLGPIVLDAQVGSSFRLTDYRFVVLPVATAYQVPYAGLEAEAGLGLSFE